jgi:3-phenylpropionate/trans-cinnamate dioxygenase ferredoxin reductase subunit
MTSENGAGAVTAHVVVVGAGLAGLRTVEALRQQGHRGRITVIGEEREEPYDRPPLSKQVLRGERGLVPLRDADYAELDIDLRLGVRAAGLDVEARQVLIDGGPPVGYDALVIATGATPRRLPRYENHPGVHVLRHARDALALRDALAGGRHLAVIGGGFIGCEVAASARALDKQVTLIEVLPHPLVRVLGEQVAVLVEQLHVEHGVTVRTSVQVQEILGNGAITGLRLSDDTVVDADLVLAGLGVEPNTAWLQGSGLEVDNGVVCDEFCATKASGVYAVGDVARWSHLGTADLRRVEHWTNAAEMAVAVATNLLRDSDSRQAFVPIPYVWSDQYDVKIQAVGFISADDDVTLTTVGANKRVLAIYGQDAKLTGAVGFSAAPQVMKIRRLLAEGGSVQDALAAVTG